MNLLLRRMDPLANTAWAAKAVAIGAVTAFGSFAAEANDQRDVRPGLEASVRKMLAQAVSPREVGRLTQLSKQASDLIGSNGVDRIARFQKIKRGWDSGSGEAWRSHSIPDFEAFLELAPTLPASASVFMSHDGNLMLSWDAAGGIVEVEFLGEQFGYFIEATGQEGRARLTAKGATEFWSLLPEIEQHALAA